MPIYEIVDLNENIENIIVADVQFVEAVFPGRWRLKYDKGKFEVPLFVESMEHTN